jgi:hypothetical protein
MTGYRKLLITLLSVVAAVLVLERSSSNATAGGNSQVGSGEENVCNDNGDQRQGQNVCEENSDCEHGNNDRCVSFCSQIQPIFDNRCTNCHNPGLFRGSMDLTRGNSYANLVNHPTSAGCMAQVPDSVRVVPCDPMASMLWRKTRPDDSRCGRPMPLGSEGLGVIAPDEFALIERWIAQGARNN